jgi:hypothetical protein
MIDLITNILKNTNCSYCQENDHNDKKEFINNWNLYLKENEMYSSLLLFNEKLDKDISYYTNKNDSISLLDSDKNIVLQLDYISNSDKTNYAVLTPNEKYIEYYEKLYKKDKKNKKLQAYLMKENYSIKIN